MKDVFPFGKPVGTEDIVGRHEFIREVGMRLTDGHSVMLAGPRRIGKSSVAWEVLRKLKESSMYTASVDLFYVTTIEEFAAKLMQSVLENRTGRYRMAIRAFDGLKDLVSKAEFRTKIHDLEIGLTLGGDKGTDVDPLELLERAIEMAETLAERDQKRMVILLDEFQEIDRLGGELLLKRLRSLFQEQKYVSYLFLGSQTTLMQTIFSDRRQAFYRFATLMDLPSISSSSWREYLQHRLSELGMRITEPALESIIERTGGHPYCVMAVAYNSYIHLKLNNLDEITADIVHYAYERTLDGLDSIYDVQWHEIHRFKHADAVLTALIEGVPPYSLPINNATVSKALENLSRISMITKGKKRGEYYLVEPMFGDWLERKQRR